MRSLDYAPRPARRGAPWWLWTLAAVSVLGGFFWFCVPLKLGGSANSARRAAARADIQQLRLGLDSFNQDVGRYPTATEALGALVAAPPGLSNWRGPCLRRAPTDPWNRPYVYVPAAGSSPPIVISAGPDGKPGTFDDILSR
jgi:general secretion pathway protein G